MKSLRAARSSWCGLAWLLAACSAQQPTVVRALPTIDAGFVVDATSAEASVSVDASALSRRVAHEPQFASRIFRPYARGGGIALAREWFDERPELDGTWPEGECYAGHETWMLEGETTSIIRHGYCASAARTLRSSHPMMQRLLRALVARVDAYDAALRDPPRQSYGLTETFESSDLRVVVTEQRQCIAHACAQISDPGTTITVVTKGHPRPWFERAYLRAFSMTRATRGLEGVGFGPSGRRMFVEFDSMALGRRDVKIVYALDPSSQQTMRRWLIGQGVARVTPNIEWQLDGTRPGLSFITMPPGFAEGVGEIHGIAEADEPWEAE